MNILFNLYVIIVLRIIHIASGIMWVGAAAFYLFLLIPNAKSTKELGQNFMRNLDPRFGMMMRITTTITVVSGGLLYARFFSGGVAWIWTTGPGLGFTIGALASLVSYGMGISIFGPTQEKIIALEKRMGDSPKPDERNEVHRLKTYLMKNYRIDFVFLVIAVLAMATARYL